MLLIHPSWTRRVSLSGKTLLSTTFGFKIAIVMYRYSYYLKKIYSVLVLLSVNLHVTAHTCTQVSLILNMLFAWFLCIDRWPFFCRPRGNTASDVPASDWRVHLQLRCSSCCLHLLSWSTADAAQSLVCAAQARRQRRHCSTVHVSGDYVGQICRSVLHVDIFLSTFRILSEIYGSL